MSHRPTTREIIQSTFQELCCIENQAHYLRDIGHSIGYTHPNIEKDLREIAKTIDECVAAIRDNDATSLMIEAERGQESMIKILEALLPINEDNNDKHS